MRCFLYDQLKMIPAGLLPQRFAVHRRVDSHWAGNRRLICRPKKQRPGETGREAADRLNQKAGVTKAQEAAMLAGSMFGWHTPAADPKNYDEQGTAIPQKHISKDHSK